MDKLCTSHPSVIMSRSLQKTLYNGENFLPWTHYIRCSWHYTLITVVSTGKGEHSWRLENLCPLPHEVRKGDYWIRHCLSVRPPQITYTVFVGKRNHYIIKAGDSRATRTQVDLMLARAIPFEILRGAEWRNLSIFYFLVNGSGCLFPSSSPL